MIQEILDYLLIKKELLTLTTEEMLDKLNNEEILAHYCGIISKMSKEDLFLYTDDELMLKVQAIVYEKRFSNKHSKELIDNMNEMLDYTHNYRTLTEYEKMLIRCNWIKEEKESRKLPLRKLSYTYTINDIYQLICYDYDSLKVLVGDFSAEFFNKLFELSTINWTCSNYPEIVFNNDTFLAYAISICSIVEGDSLLYKRMVKETKEQLQNLTNEKTIEFKKITKKKEINRKD